MTKPTAAWDKKHTTIIEAAKRIFIEKGYSASSMDAIATKADVSKVTVYNHFANKKELFATIMANHCRGFTSGKHLIQFDHTKSPHDILVRFCHRFIEVLLLPDSIALMRRIIAEIDLFPDLSHSMWHEGMPIFESFCQYLIAEEETNRLQVADKEIATRQLFGMIKENTVYPIWFGLSPLLNRKRTNQIVETSVNLFLKSYAN